jgi:hypothetical protein
VEGDVEFQGVDLPPLLRQGAAPVLAPLLDRPSFAVALGRWPSLVALVIAAVVAKDWNSNFSKFTV